MKNFSEIKENDIFYHIKISNSQIMHGEKENPLMEVKVERIIKGTSGDYASIAFSPADVPKGVNRVLAITVNLADDIHIVKQGLDPINLAVDIYGLSKEKVIEKALELVNETIKKITDFKKECDETLDNLLISGSIFELMTDSIKEEIDAETMASMAL